MLTVLDLFSGIGGISLGLESTGGFRTVAFCEIEPFPRAVLRKHWPEVPIYEDVRALRGQPGGADVVCGGFPCVDISSAGKKVGIRGSRSGLWREFARLVGEIRPRYVIVENVSALLSRGMGEVLADLASLGYDAEWHCIPAAAVGAPHIRERVWILGYPNSDSKPACAVDDEAPRLPSNAAHAKRGVGALGRNVEGARWQRQLDAAISGAGEWPNPPEDVGVDDGLPGRMDRLSALGNAVVPAIVHAIGQAILEAERHHR